jgi:hypothetical protein
MGGGGLQTDVLAEYNDPNGIMMLPINIMFCDARGEAARVFIGPDGKSQAFSCRQWNDWRTGAVHFEMLRDFHWRRESGGVRALSPRPLLHARIACDSLVSGEISHSCAHGTGPHEILVRIVKKGNRAIFCEIEDLARNSREHPR